MSSKQVHKDTKQIDVRIAKLEHEIEALNARLPKHSTPPSMIIELEDLEDELQSLRAARSAGVTREQE